MTDINNISISGCVSSAPSMSGFSDSAGEGVRVSFKLCINDTTRTINKKVYIDCVGYSNVANNILDSVSEGDNVYLSGRLDYYRGYKLRIEVYRKLWTA